MNVNEEKLKTLIECACFDCHHCPCYKQCKDNDFMDRQPCDDIVRDWLLGEQRKCYSLLILRKLMRPHT